MPGVDNDLELPESRELYVAIDCLRTNQIEVLLEFELLLGFARRISPNPISPRCHAIEGPPPTLLLASPARDTLPVHGLELELIAPGPGLWVA